MSKQPIKIGDSNFTFGRRSEMLLSASLLGVLVVLLVPLPPVLLDMLLATNLGVTIILMLVTLSVRRPLEMSVFPSLLLLLTLFRLSLNVATTRLILLDGSAGKIVETFGGIVVGGNLVVGLVIFLILVIVQFIVITKGAGRVSEVAARFTLDALPGKQMAIDAELNSGSINDEVARQRRESLAQETEFYGAMDGASKFVRGDAIAGLIVTAINLIGGIILGVYHGMSLPQAATTYSILTVGDGLISQIPALIIATSSGILVTKTTSEQSLGQEIGGQLMKRTTPLLAGAGILGLLALTPGLPKLPFLLLAGGIFAATRGMRDHDENAEATAGSAEPATEPPGEDDRLVSDFVSTDRACVEVGARLVRLVDSRTDKGLAEQIPRLRQQLTKQHGLWIPAIRIRDNLKLSSESYRILINGREVARGELRPDQLLVVNAGHGRPDIEGEATVEPAFGSPATWIQPSQRQRVEMSGLTIVAPTSVLVTHLGEVLRRYAQELLSREDLQHLLDRLKEVAPTIVEELKPDVLRTSTLHQVLIRLLEERVPVTDLGRIVECALAHAIRTKDPGELAELLRRDLGRSICDPFRDEHGRVRVMVLSPQLQSQFRQSMHGQDIVVRQDQLERLVSRLKTELGKSEIEGKQVALLADDVLRRSLRTMLQRSLGDLVILGYQEIPRDLLIEQVALIDLPDLIEPGIATREMTGSAP